MSNNESNEDPPNHNKDRPFIKKTQLAPQYEPFQDFNLQKWIEWIKAFIANEQPPPRLNVGDEELHRTLGRLYNNLLDPFSRDIFAEAVFLIYRSTPHIEVNAQQLHCLINLIALTLPIKAKELINYQLRRKSLLALNYANQNLHTVLLVACGEYDVDEDLADYVKNSASEIRDFQYFLVCLRILSARGDSQAYQLLERVLPYVESEVKAAKLIRELFTVARNTGYRQFYNWYRSRTRILASRFSKQWEQFDNSLIVRLLPSRLIPELVKKDAYAVVFSALLHAKRNLLTPEIVLTLGRIHAVLGFEETVDSLVYVWEKAYSYLNEFPWEFISSGDGHGFIQKAAVQINGDIVEFDPIVEPEVELILLHVSDICEIRHKDAEVARVMKAATSGR